MLLSTALLLSGVLLAFAGLALLALSQKKHAEVVLGRRVARTNSRIAVPVGGALVLASLIPCVLRDGVSFAALLWPLLVAGASAAVALTLSYKPKLLKPLAKITNWPGRERD